MVAGNDHAFPLYSAPMKSTTTTANLEPHATPFFTFLFVDCCAHKRDHLQTLSFGLFTVLPYRHRRVTSACFVYLNEMENGVGLT